MASSYADCICPATCVPIGLVSAATCSVSEEAGYADTVFEFGKSRNGRRGATNANLHSELRTLRREMDGVKFGTDEMQRMMKVASSTIGTEMKFILSADEEFFTTRKDKYSQVFSRRSWFLWK